MSVGARTAVPRLARWKQTREPIWASLRKPLVSARACAHCRRRRRKGGRRQQPQSREAQNLGIFWSPVGGGSHTALDLSRRRRRGTQHGVPIGSWGESVRCRVWREDAAVPNDSEYLPKRTCHCLCDAFWFVWSFVEVPWALIKSQSPSRPYYMYMLCDQVDAKLWRHGSVLGQDWTLLYRSLRQLPGPALAPRTCEHRRRPSALSSALIPTPSELQWHMFPSSSTMTLLMWWKKNWTRLMPPESAAKGRTWEGK